MPHQPILKDPPFTTMPWVLARFWQRIKQDDNGCWIWTGSRKRNPPGFDYGFISIRSPTGNKAVAAHRIALAIQLGRWPRREELALHRCNNPPCCNPLHIKVGNHADNHEDARKAGTWRPRWVRGMRSARQNLSDEQVEEVIKDYFGEDGNGRFYLNYRNEVKWNILALAAKYRIPHTTVRAILSGRTKNSYLLSGNQVKAMRKLWESEEGQGYEGIATCYMGKWTNTSLAKRFKVKIGVINTIINGTSYRHIPRPWYDRRWYFNSPESRGDRGLVYRKNEAAQRRARERMKIANVEISERGS